MYMPLFISAILSLILVVEMLSRYTRSRMVLLIFLLTCTLLYFSHATFFMHYTQWIPVTDSLYSFCNVAVFPLFYIYLSELTRTTRALHLRQWLCLLPALVCFMLVTSGYLMMSHEETVHFIEKFLYHNLFVDGSYLSFQVVAHLVVKVVFALQIIPVVVVGSRKIMRYSHFVRGRLDDSDNRRLLQVKVLFILFIVTSLTSFVFNLVGRYRFADHPALLVIPSFTFSFLIFTLSYIGIRFREDTSDLEETDNKSAIHNDHHHRDDDGTEKNIRLQDTDNTLELCQRIEELMEKELLYLKADLKISDITSRLHTNRNYIYNAINKEMGLSFADFVNRHRIDYATKMMAEQPELQINEISLKSGYNSSSSFYRNFKFFMGCTPKEYYARLHE